MAVKLRNLALEESAVNDPGVRVLGKAFRDARGGALTSLNLARNKLTDAAAESLAGMLSCGGLSEVWVPAISPCMHEHDIREFSSCAMVAGVRPPGDRPLVE